MVEFLVKLFKYIGHPIPAWTHIKHITLSGELTCPSTKGGILLKDCYIPTFLGKKRGC